MSPGRSTARRGGPRIPVTLAMAAALGCGHPQANRQPAPKERVDLALTALHQGDLALAALRLRPEDVSGNDVAGRRAVLLGALLALDARNADRDPDLAARLAGQYLTMARDPFDLALGNFVYGLAFDLGAAPRTRQPGTQAPLPRVPVPTLADRLRVLDSAVADLRAELTRVRETLKP